MFEAKLANSGLLKKIVESIKDLVTVASFDCSETAMSLQAMDSSHVALVSLKLEVGLFDTYRCDKPIHLGLSLANLAKVMKCANNDDKCMFKHEENHGDSIIFTFADPKHDKIQNVPVQMMDINSEKLGIPKVDYDVVCEMPAAEFQKTCRDLAMFSDALSITATKASIVFTGKGDIRSPEVIYAPSANINDESEGVTLEVKEPVSLQFSNQYMNMFTKATALSDRVRLSLSNDEPIAVEYPIEENGFLRFYLAPRIEDDDME